MLEHEWWLWKANVEDVLRSTDSIDACAHSGDCKSNVRDTIALPEVAEVIDRLPRRDPWLVRELRETGAWTDAELEDHDLNVVRMVWIIACDAKENDTEQRNALQRGLELAWASWQPTEGA